jgi:PAS domain S-box-containing protein
MIGEAEQAARPGLPELERSQLGMRSIADALPVLISYVDQQCRYGYANSAYESWFGRPASAIVGRHLREVLGEAAYQDVRLHVERALRGETVHFRTWVHYQYGSQRFIDACYTPQRAPDGSVLGFVALVHDVSERQRIEEARELASQRSARLMTITAAIADAITADQVYEAVVTQTALAVGARRAGLWLAEPPGSLGRIQGAETAAPAGSWGGADSGNADANGGVPAAGTGVASLADAPPLVKRLRLVYSMGYLPELAKRLELLCMDGAFCSKLAAMQHAEPIWVTSRQELQTTPCVLRELFEARAGRICMLPIAAHRRTLAVLALQFDEGATWEADCQDFLVLVTRHGGQALERLRLLALERQSRLAAEAAAARMTVLHALAHQVISATRVEQIFEAALDAIEQALGTKRAAVLVCDSEGVMRFRAWRGLSADYRSRVEGHSPWTSADVSPAPVLVADVEREQSLAAYCPAFRKEQIRALGFIPLLAGSRLLGKFMVYYDQPHQLEARELEMVQAIANHVAATLARFGAVTELEQTVRFNELFVGILGHDLRNPLNSILTAAQITSTRSSDVRIQRPLSRIMTSGARMTRMVEQLLDFSRVRLAGGIPLKPKRCDVAQLVEQVLEELDAADGARSIQLQRRGDTCGNWDEDRLWQVFSNLIGNALRHGELAADVEVTLDGERAEAMVIEVHNAGCIPDDLLPSLFEPLATGKRRRDKAQGLGLGLFISREIVRAHAGSIQVRSSSAAGTTFVVQLPR